MQLPPTGLRKFTNEHALWNSLCSPTRSRSIYGERRVLPRNDLASSPVMMPWPDRNLIHAVELKTVDHRVIAAKLELALVRTTNLREENIRAFNSWLSDRERVCALRYLRDQDRVAYIVSHGLLRMELWRRFPGLKFPVVIEAVEQGKPHVAGYPHQVDFNISHTKGLAACVTAQGAQVGVDCEALSREVSPEVIETGLSEPERNWLEQQAGPTSRSFLRLWTLKEAAAKAVGLGLSADFRSFATLPTQMIDAGPDLRCDGNWWLWQEVFYGEFVVAVALVASDPNGPRLQGR